MSKPDTQTYSAACNKSDTDTTLYFAEVRASNHTEALIAAEAYFATKGYTGNCAVKLASSIQVVFGA